MKHLTCLFFCLTFFSLSTFTSNAQEADTLVAKPNTEAETISEPKEPKDTPKVVKDKTLDEVINDKVAPATKWLGNIVFFKAFDVTSEDENTGEEKKTPVPFLLIWLLIGGIIITCYFKFVNLRSIPLAIRTVKGRYTPADAPGEITHFQALTAALSATVGLGNIAGVAVAISMGGPGAAFWMIIMGFLGMSTKFAECTLGVKYRDIDSEGKTRGGPMRYMQKGFAEMGLAPVGKVLAILFALLCVGAAMGGGNMFQVNQVCDQLITVTGGETSFFSDRRWIFGLIICAVVAVIILGGITRIATITSRIVPVMCGVYILGALVVIGSHFSDIPSAIGLIVTEAFAPKAYVGGIIGAILQGIKRGTFSNEAGIGSAPIAHSAVKTNKPASEGLVALLEPFTDTILVCSLTALVIVITGTYGETYNTDDISGVALTSEAFSTVISWFPYVLFVAVLLFALSTLISWSYYGQQAWCYLFGHSSTAQTIYKVIFCLFIVIGSSLSLGQVVDFSDYMLLGMAFPNLFAVYFLLPKVKQELRDYEEHVAKVDSQS